MFKLWKTWVIISSWLYRQCLSFTPSHGHWPWLKKPQNCIMCRWVSFLTQTTGLPQHTSFELLSILCYFPFLLWTLKNRNVQSPSCHPSKIQSFQPKKRTPLCSWPCRWVRSYLLQTFISILHDVISMTRLSTNVLHFFLLACLSTSSLPFILEESSKICLPC